MCFVELMLFKRFFGNLTLFYFKGKKIVGFDKIAGPVLPCRYKRMTSSEAWEKSPPTIITCPVCLGDIKPKQGKIINLLALAPGYLEKPNMDPYYYDAYVRFPCMFLESTVVLAAFKQDTDWDTTWFILYQFRTSRKHFGNCSCYWRQNPVKLVKAVPRAKPAGLKS